MPAQGLLTETGVLIQKPSDASRLHGKSHFGTPLPNNQLRLNYIESLYLLNENKLIIHNTQKKVLSFQDLVKIATDHHPNFDSQFLIYRDLRKRGYSIRQNEIHNQITFYHQPKKQTDQIHHIKTFTEHDDFSIQSTNKILNKLKSKKEQLWYGIVDEEGDLTYYDVRKITPKGNIKNSKYTKCQAIVIDDRAILFDSETAKKLHETEFYGKPFGSGHQLSIIEAIYLTEQKFLTLESPTSHPLAKTQLMKKYSKIYPDIGNRLIVYKDLKKRGLIVKTGYKFGAHFRAYTKKPEKTHAEYLIHVVSRNYKQRWAEISRAIRLAHSVNKEILFAQINKKIVEYIRIGRLRP
jgi:tRNA-intron endonuclease